MIRRLIAGRCLKISRGGRIWTGHAVAEIKRFGSKGFQHGSRFRRQSHILNIVGRATVAHHFDGRGSASLPRGQHIGAGGGKSYPKTVDATL